jgi:hypothetical protein
MHVAGPVSINRCPYGRLQPGETLMSKRLVYTIGEACAAARVRRSTRYTSSPRTTSSAIYTRALIAVHDKSAFRKESQQNITATQRQPPVAAMHREGWHLLMQEGEGV